MLSLQEDFHLTPANIVIKCIVLCIVCWHFLHGKTIDILVRWDLSEVYDQDWSAIHESGYDVRVFNLGFGQRHAKVREYLDRHYSSNTQKIIVMEDFIPREILSSISKSEIVLFMWEPIGKTEDCDYYSYVYTFNDDLVGTKNYRKFVYPHVMPVIADPIPFEEKKMCTAVISHWLPEREQVMNFFEQFHPQSFDLYGANPGPFAGSLIYKGQIAGHHSALPKRNVLMNYKFVLAFENSACPRYNITSGYCAPGYITEKIFGVFAAGAVPVYLGPANIERYIPNNCFISYQDFNSPQECYHFLQHMTKETYEQYLQNIRKYLQHDRIFSQATFEHTILEAAES